MNTQKHKQNIVEKLIEPQAVSMVIALALVALIAIITMTSNYILVTSVGTNADFGASLRAQSAAESGLNLALGLVKGKGVGTDLSLHYYCYSHDGEDSTYGTGNAPTTYPCTENTTEYSVTSSAQTMIDSPNTYILPPPGEGDAGEFCERAENYDDGQLANLDKNLVKPCNWNKLYFGENVSIPLFIEGENNNRINPSMTNLTVKVRTPCEDGIEYDNGFLASGAGDEPWCNGGRPDLMDPTPGDFTNGDDIVVNWSLTGICEYDGVSSGPCVGHPVPGNSDITTTRVKVAKDIMNYKTMGSDGVGDNVLDLNTTIYNTSTPNIPIINYLKSMHSSLPRPNTVTRDFNEPYLNLSVVNRLRDANGEGVPYIEYQIETDEQIAYAFQIAESLGISGSFRKTLKAQKEPGSSHIQFVIQN